MTVRGVLDTARVRLRRLLPEGRSLSTEVWVRRHRAIVALLWLHAAALTAFAMARGFTIRHAVTEGSVVAGAALVASWRRGGRNLRSAAGALGLVLASAVLVHLSGGVIEAHFHFFVMVAVLTLYQEWRPFIIAIAFVLLHHGGLGVLAPHDVYNHYAALNNPWKWAGIHALFVAAASLANLGAWRSNEEAQVELESSYRQLQDSEQRFRSHFADAAVGQAMTDLEGRFIAVNRSFCEITGYSQAELLALDFETITHPDDRNRNREELARLLRGETEAFDIEKRYLRKGGGVVHVLNSVSVTRDAHGLPVYVTAVIQDVTDRTRAEEQLRLLQAVSLAAAEAVDLQSALAVALRRVCEVTGWICAQAWLPASEGAVLELAPAWYSAGPAVERFRAASANRVFRPGEGLPGRAWASGLPVWIRDISLDDNFPRAADAAGVGFTSAMAVPILAGDDVVGVMEFFVFEPRHEDERLLAIVSAVGRQIGNAFERKAAEEALRESEERYRTTVETASDAFVRIDAEGVIADWNRQAETMFGWAAREAIGRCLADTLVPPEHREAHSQGLKRFLETGEGPVLNRSIEVTALHRDSTTFPIELTIWPTREGGRWFFNAFLRDITERRRADQALRDSEGRYRGIVETAQEGVWLIDGEGRTTFVNQKMAELLGAEVEEMAGSSLVEFLDERDKPGPLAERRWESFLDQQELRFVRRDGTALWARLAASAVHDESGRYAGALAMVSDITQRKAAEEALVHQAFHDTLTQLPNRALFLDRLSQALARRQRRATETAVLFLDVDRFKWVNDSLGHGAGDQLLVVVAERIQSALRPGDTVARFGGDEFVVLCEDLGGERDALAVAQRLARSLAVPFELDHRQFGLTVSVGIAFASGDDDPTSLLRDADAAMYRAKERGRDRVELFDERMRSRAMARLETESALRRALEEGHLQVYYQPVVDLNSGATVGLEALVRWEHPEWGLVQPSEFIPLAEDTGLILPVGALVLAQACRQVARWHLVHPERPALVLSVNLSGRQLSSPGLTEVVADTLRDSGLDPAALCLEITESVLMDDATSARGGLEALKALGVSVAVDDFGTGYSSLSYLRQFPVDVLKVDRSFVSGLERSREDAAIVAGIIGLANALSLGTVAEGVETARQAAQLLGLGCRRAQGYHWSRPLPAGDAWAWVEGRWAAEPLQLEGGGPHPVLVPPP
ncbi:MAG: PAS domain S-box protein [Actinomycetota bacterium]|nr:PAS domain S-box protein [Actinomycetota bacterium]